MYIRVYTCIYVFIRVYTCMYMYIRAYMCTYVHMRAYTCIYVHISACFCFLFLKVVLEMHSAFIKKHFPYWLLLKSGSEFFFMLDLHENLLKHPKSHKLLDFMRGLATHEMLIFIGFHTCFNTKII